MKRRLDKAFSRLSLYFPSALLAGAGGIGILLFVQTDQLLLHKRRIIGIVPFPVLQMFFYGRTAALLQDKSGKMKKRIGRRNGCQDKRRKRILHEFDNKRVSDLTQTVYALSEYSKSGAFPEIQMPGGAGQRFTEKQFAP